MPRPRKYPKEMSYTEKFGARDSLYAMPRRVFTPRFYYQFYIGRGHWKFMDRKRMRELLIPILPHLTEKEQSETSSVLKELKKKVKNK